MVLLPGRMIKIFAPTLYISKQSRIQNQPLHADSPKADAFREPVSFALSSPNHDYTSLLMNQFSKMGSDGTYQQWPCWHWCLFLTGQFGRKRPNLIDRAATSDSLEISQAPAKLRKKRKSINDNAEFQESDLLFCFMLTWLGQMTVFVTIPMTQKTTS